MVKFHVIRLVYTVNLLLNIVTEVVGYKRKSGQEDGDFS
jgi:hypothetical protein